MPRLLLVRHAMPALDPETDPAEWVLGPEGVAAARQLGPVLPADAVLVSSDEPKALGTLAAAAPGREIIIEPGLREVDRPREPFGGGFRELRLAYVAGRPPAGWEAPAAVAARIGAAVTRHRHETRPLVLAGHGMAFTTWLASRGLVADPVAFWSALRLPEVVEAMADHVMPRREVVLGTGRLLLRPWRVAEAAVQHELWTERDPRVPPHPRLTTIKL